MNERVIARDANNVADPLSFDFVNLLHITGQMSLGTTGRKTARDPEDYEFLSLRQVRNVHLVCGGPFVKVHAWKFVSDLYKIPFFNFH